MQVKYGSRCPPIFWWLLFLLAQIMPIWLSYQWRLLRFTTCISLIIWGRWHCILICRSWIKMRTLSLHLKRLEKYYWQIIVCRFILIKKTLQVWYSRIQFLCRFLTNPKAWLENLIIIVQDIRSNVTSTMFEKTLQAKSPLS